MDQDRNKLEDLLDEYWDLAFDQGREYSCNGLRANQVRKSIRELFRNVNCGSAPEGGDK